MNVTVLEPGNGFMVQVVIVVMGNKNNVNIFYFFQLYHRWLETFGDARDRRSVFGKDRIDQNSFFIHLQ